MAAQPDVGYEILGAVKIKDGLFIGDELAAQDLEFVVANKVSLSSVSVIIDIRITRARIKLSPVLFSTFTPESFSPSGNAHHQLLRAQCPESLGEYRGGVLDLLLAGP